ncbi:hypothetical protein B0T18DRAFT_251735 [Schizothecium vesticola]|uniref:Uncharacterized protein n=1 Tax=Schizothecium vesticola TaxID=314040 RepID=A0AA40EHC6_9PEZI|nr:hypothetical protein B0T18DRAFT_251735 [Schizothecium vesticola]
MAWRYWLRLFFCIWNWVLDHGTLGTWGIRMDGVLWTWRGFDTARLEFTPSFPLQHSAGNPALRRNLVEHFPLFSYSHVFPFQPCNLNSASAVISRNYPPWSQALFSMTSPSQTAYHHNDNSSSSYRKPGGNTKCSPIQADK